MDPVRTEVMKNRFAAIVEEGSSIAYRTAHTTFVKMTQDYQVALATPEGEYFAYPYMSGVTNFIGLSLRATIREIGVENMSPGDIVICNDPFGSEGMCTHTMDIHLLKPIFHGARIVGFAWAFIHASDVGGAVPGSISPTSTDVFQEGIRMRATFLYRKGELNEQLLMIFRDNCRIPDQNWGDLQAMIAALKTMERRLVELCDKHGVEEIEGGIRDAMDFAEMKARSVIAAIPDGEWVFGDYLEGVRNPEDTIFVQARMTVRGEEVWLDFTGSDPQVQAALNFVTGDSSHPFLGLAIINYVLTMEPDIPINNGIIRPIHTHAPKGTIANAVFPAAMGNRWVTVMRVFDAVLGCLNQALGGGPVTAGAGQGGIILCAFKDPATGLRKASVVQPLIGGSGGRSSADGIDGVDGPFGFLRSTPVEAIEVDTPLIIRRFALQPDSLAAGYHRSGAGVVIDMENTDVEVLFTVRGLDRFVLRPWGTNGGHAGTTGRAILNPGREDERDIGKIKVLEIGYGDVLRMMTPAGGGYGDPLDREVDRIMADLRSGLLSRGRAESDYGLVFAGDAVDEAATADRRRALRAARGPVAAFVYGPERDAHDRIWPRALRAKLAERALTLSPALRNHMLDDVRDSLRAADKTVDEAVLDAAVAAWIARHGAMRGREKTDRVAAE
ncbi:MAG: hydantoinase B/oxoprolinase family protein [Proteobacteria bacterium]|nr:hydantoinase B/oxoprolinase family protein [Pseudomonadota bacterium]